MLNVQNYLLNHSLDDLENEHAVEVSFADDGIRFQLNYNQISAVDSNIVAQESRGLILCKSNQDKLQLSSNGKPDTSVVVGSTEVVAFPFMRFFNYGQDAAKCNLDDPSLKVYEKCDGTLIILHHFNQWRVATRKTPDANLPINPSTFTFRTLFEKALDETTGLSFEDYTSQLDKDVTYMFELMTPYNQVVVRHKNCRIALLGARNIKTLKEYKLEDIKNIVPKAKTFNLSKIADIVDYVNSTNPSDEEGTVLCDSNFKRMKVKSPQYVIASKSRDTLAKSPRSVIELILLGKEDDCIPILPEEIVNDLLDKKERVADLFTNIKQNYKYFVEEVNKYPDSEKVKKANFAKFVKQSNVKLSDAYFAMFSGKASSLEQYVSNQQSKTGSYSTSFLDKIIESI